MIPRSDTYQAEILRFIHDQPSGTLRDSEVGVVKRIWLERGQLCGEHIGSISSALSELESKGSLVSETATLGTGRRGRVAVAVVEEPPHGETIYHPRAVGEGHDGPGFDTGPDRYPTAEEVAAELLKLAVAAASVPVVDIRAALHHNECLRAEIDDWVQVAEEAESRAVAANDELLTLRVELDELHGVTNKVDAEWAAKYDELRRLYDDRGEVITRLEAAPPVTVYAELKELRERFESAQKQSNTQISDGRERERGLLTEVAELRKLVDDWKTQYEELEHMHQLVSAIAQGEVNAFYALLDETTKRDLSAIIQAGRIARRTVSS